MAGPSDQDAAREKNFKLLPFWRPTDSWVRVHQRRLGEQNILWRVLRTGDPLKGTVVFKVEEAKAAWSVFIQISAADDTVYWMRAHATEPLSRQEVDAYLRTATARDPDLWVIETDKAVMSLNDRGPFSS